MDNKKPVKAKGPASVQVEICAYCNLRCKMCYYSNMTRPKGNMTDEVFAKVLKDSKELGITRLRLFVYGEPLLHPRLPEFLRMMREVGMEADITTNGLALTPELIKTMIGEKVWRVIFSIEGIDKKTYENIRIGGNFEKAVANIKALKSAVREAKSRMQVKINTLVMDDTVTIINEFTKYWVSLGIPVIRHHVMTQGGTVPDYGKKSRGQAGIRAARSGRCNAPSTKLVIYWDGRVGFCCSDGDAVTAYANINTKTLKEIWEGPELAKVRWLFNNGKVEFCKKCVSYSIPKKPIVISHGEAVQRAKAPEVRQGKPPNQIRRKLRVHQRFVNK